VCVDTATWEPNVAQLQAAKASSNVDTIFLYIDFPGQVADFKKLSAERQADILTSFAAKQKEKGYTFIYNVLQEVPDDVGWDATKIKTSDSGPYHGQTIFEVMKGLMDRYNPPMTGCP